MEKTLYLEIQSFNQLWLKWLMAIVNVITIFTFLTGFYIQFVKGSPWGNKPMSDTTLLITGIFTILLVLGSTYLVFSLKLIIEVTTEKIKYKFTPLINKPKIISKDMIARYEIRKYSPIKNYGGWGIRISITKWGYAYTVSGNMGIQFYLKNGKKILLGTKDTDIFKSAIDTMMSKKQF